MVFLYIVLGVIFLFGIVAFRGAPYVPSHKRFAEKSLTELYKLSTGDTLVDVGSGDGVILRIAANKGARAIGYEINPILVAISKLLSIRQPLVTTRFADFWLTKLPQETTIVYAFSVTRDMDKMERKLQETADDTGHAVWFVTYGSTMKQKVPVRTLDAHTLYLFEPK
ncbi:hypothetical protein A2707_05875 [Candidatus Saccharibacteria bacterium RIFCSPHIGHO2_01_FULL_45_15]|nr:MAG: hypothetical protein A2707_05875 [Candidatus Saccharibacteria bacterium RIFCSPHIGHO2_01_FULL_45_15]OGL28974.1 MAG: hypothetical protein A3C39_06095 [Candidatus Saccharibacteria bacterium RIFCSPHIGHO2_02_FULL_46_12]OGL31988.1 MAG: hypothetical protein A3E76_01820 [Candidatus Saccharibacteria bacterium RIFCSPHIGHO2_12_FULL_44_22]